MRMISEMSDMKCTMSVFRAMIVMGLLAGCSTQPVSQGRMPLNVSLSMYSVNYFNRLALEHPFFDCLMSISLVDTPLSDLTWIVTEQTGISIHAIDHAGDKTITVAFSERSLRSILLELAATYGLLYEVRLSSSGEIVALMIYNVDPMRCGVES